MNKSNLPHGLEINDFNSDPIYIEIIHFLDLAFPRWRYADGLAENAVDFLYDNRFFAEQTILDTCNSKREALMQLYDMLSQNYRELLSKDRNINDSIDFIFDTPSNSKYPLEIPLNYLKFISLRKDNYYFDFDQREE